MVFSSYTVVALRKRRPYSSLLSYCKHFDLLIHIYIISHKIRVRRQTDVRKNILQKYKFLVVLEVSCTYTNPDCSLS